MVLLTMLCEPIGSNDINLNLCPLDLHRICSFPSVKYVNRQSIKLDLSIVKVSVMSFGYGISIIGCNEVFDDFDPKGNAQRKDVITTNTD